MDVYQKLTELLAAGRSGVLITLVAVDGSSPRAPGTKMLVSGNEIIAGSIGGGGLEHEMMRLAPEVQDTGEARLVTYADKGDAGMACGGRCSVFLEPVTTGSRLIIIGCGHVGRSLAGLAGDCGMQVMVLDDRDLEDVPACRFLVLENYEDPFAGLGICFRDCLVIAGRSHAVDLQVLRAALATPAGFIGMLGSSKKKEAFFATLGREGVDEKQLARVITPVGLDIGARSPAEIAVSIMAQLLARRQVS